MTNKSIFISALAIAIVHFLATSVIAHFISVQIGTHMGQVVAEGLRAASDKNTEEDATRIYENMKRRSDEINNSWKIPELIISLPAKPLMSPLLKEMRQNQVNKLITKEISRDQFRTQGLVIDYAAKFLNSLCLGLLVYIALRTVTSLRR